MIPHKITGGETSRERFGKLLGLDKNASSPVGRWEISSVSWERDRISIMLKSGRDTLDVYLVPLETEGLRLRCSHLKIGFGAQIARSQVNFISVSWPKRLEGVSLSLLHRLLLSDPGSLLEPLERSASITGTWGKQDQWRCFFSDKEMNDSSVAGFIDSMTQNTSLRILHTDHECNSLGNMQVNFFNFYNKLKSASMRDNSITLSTDIKEDDVIMGSHRKLEDLFNAIGEVPPDSFLWFTNTCVPMLSGEDVRSIVRRFQTKCSCHIVYLHQTLNSAAEVFLKPLSEIRETPGFLNVKKKPGTINLVGFDPDTSTEELTQILGEAGIRVNVRVFPEYSAEDFANYMAADAQVFFMSKLHEKVFQDFMSSMPLKTIVMDPPFGLERTEEWLRGIAAEFGRDNRLGKIWTRLMGESRPALEKLAKEAAGYRLGIILDTFQVEKFFDPANTFGAPIARMIEEMGFGLDFMIHAELKEAFAGRAGFIRNALRDPDRHTIKRFQTPEELDNLLTGAPFQAVYSDYFFDRRLTGHGLSQFSAAQFEKGLQGFMRTAERLLAICRMPFYRTYMPRKGGQC